MDARDEPGGAPSTGLRHGLRVLAQRLRCSPSEALAVSLLVAGAAAGLGLLWLLAAPRFAGAPAPPAVEGLVTGSDAAALATPGVAGATPLPAAGIGTAGTAGPATPPAGLVVHVAGQVAVPGIYRLPGGSRVAEAVERAGGVLGDADVDALNLARALVDGEQVRVPAVGEQLAPTAAASPGSAAPQRPDGTLDLNLAALADLDELPGVGPVLAQRILDHRAEIGRFTTVEELRDVKGVGEATFADLAPEVSV